MGTCWVVWWKHRHTLRAGGDGYAEFRGTTPPSPPAKTIGQVSPLGITGAVGLAEDRAAGGRSKNSRRRTTRRWKTFPPAGWGSSTRTSRGEPAGGEHHRRRGRPSAYACHQLN